MSTWRQDLKNDLIAGLLVVIPLATTVWATLVTASWVVQLLTRIPKQLNPLHLPSLLQDLVNLSVGLAVPLLGIFFIGLMARNIAGRWLLNLGEQILQQIPLAGSVYKTLKQLLETLLRDSSQKFRRVVLVEYPRRDVWAVAFVTGTPGEVIERSLPLPRRETLVSVFIPSTPNPATGWYAMMPERDIVPLPISVEEAFKLVISGGIVNPTLAVRAEIFIQSEHT
ncbi:hypothetical protein GlitD10_2654 [Gloeomargarita lithophora Alchichica-D10]|uniref:Transporter n=1 Tax=Gloeomargarita lithophora Alchichica-D10 TaxID=1188229 RepID=A0A1J0AGC7_9CYAN|nr:DUF502 domain-containing protein [Gloeomargarita lithophora]APB34996.1 hypothetical protein GlitD10_2654 [Gloeomargarita lithophora Alchichica-D10]